MVSSVPSTPQTSRPGLLRAVSRWQIVGLAINDVVGSGIYLLPAAVPALLGSASVWAVVLAGGAVALLVLCFAEASSHFDEPGGAYLYAREAFGRFGRDRVDDLAVQDSVARCLSEWPGIGEHPLLAAGGRI